MFILLMIFTQNYFRPSRFTYLVNLNFKKQHNSKSLKFSYKQHHSAQHCAFKLYWLSVSGDKNALPASNCSIYGIFTAKFHTC